MNEGIQYKKNKINLDFENDFEKDIVKLTLNSKMVVKKSKFNKTTIYYAYSLNNSNINPKIKKKIIDIFKNKHGISEDKFERLINKAIIKLNSIEPLSNIDIIMTPKAKSPVLQSIIEKVKAKSGDSLLISDEFAKNNIENINIDFDKYLSKFPNEIKDIKRKELENMIAKATRDGEFKLKNIPPQFRGLFSNYLIFKTNTCRNIYNKIQDGNVLILDDIKTTGETLKESIRLVNSLVPKNIIIFVLFRNQVV